MRPGLGISCRQIEHPSAIIVVAVSDNGTDRFRLPPIIAKYLEHKAR